MTRSAIVNLRLQNQHLMTPTFKTASDAVQWFGAVQAQDYLGSLWAVGMRMKTADEKTIEDALKERTVVRSWPMRGTLHFTHAQDLRWMLELLAPRVIKRAAFRYRELELTDDMFQKSGEILAKALIGGKQLIREEIFTLLDKNGVSPSGQRGIHILGYLAMQGLLCFGERRGKQFTFTLLDEWIPRAKAYTPAHALSEITKRYFTSHGPATIKDFCWWTGLTVSEAKIGIERMKQHLHHDVIDGQTYWSGSIVKEKTQSETKAWLLPAYDEYAVAYKDRSDIIESNHFIQAGNGLRPTIVINGKIIGTWKRELKKHEVILTPHLFHMLNKTEHDALMQAAHNYGTFLGRAVKLL